MAIRLVTLEFEARLAALDGHGGSGKIERKTYDDGHTALKARVRDLDDTSGELELYINESSVGLLKRARKRAELELDSRDGDAVPEVKSGDIAEVWAGVEVISRGQFVED